MRTLLLLVLAALWTGAFSACGGGGGGGDAPCAPPGSLAALAVQGAPAPGTAGGTYGPLAAATPLAAGNGGWAAFAAPVGGGDTTSAVFVAPPDAAPLRVLARGDPAPDATGGSIGDVVGLWLTGGGWLLAQVTVTGGGPTEGLVTARIAGGAVAEVHGVLWDDENLAGTGLPGTIQAFLPGTIHLADDGTVFFGGATGSGDGFWRVDPDGTGIQLLVARGAPLGGPRAVGEILAAAVSADGERFAFLAEPLIPGARGIYAAAPGDASFGRIAEEGMALAPGESIDLLPDGQYLVVYPSTTGTGVLFEATSDVGEAHLLVGSTSASQFLLVARQGDTASRGATGLNLGTYGDLGLLHNGSTADAPAFWAQLVGSTAGTDFALYGYLPNTSAPTPALLEGAAAPPGGIGNFTSTMLGVARLDGFDTSSGGGLVVVDVLSNGRVGVFWLLPGCGSFQIALSGNTVPGGGDTFLASNQWRATTAEDVVVIRASLTTAGSGLYRRGP